MHDIARRDERRKHNLSFTGQKLDWMTAAAYDRRLKPSDFRVAFIIAQHANEDEGKAFPSEELIADRIGTHVRTVTRSVKLLDEIGWLKIRRTRVYNAKTKTWKTRNTYWLQHQNVPVIFDAITASKLGRRFKRDTDVTSKPDTHVTLTPSEKHLQKRRSLPREGKDKREVRERVSALIAKEPPIDGQVVSIGDRRLIIMREVLVGGRRLRVIENGQYARTN